MSSGLGPSAGLYGAIFLSFFAALFGGTATQISGPTAPMTAVSMVVIATIIGVHNGSVEKALPYILAVFLLDNSPLYAFAKIDFPFRNIIFYGLLISLMIPEIISLLPHLLIIRGDIFPLPFGPSWMNSLKGLTIPFFGNVFLIFLLRQYFKKIPNELWDAARIDGASHFLI